MGRPKKKNVITLFETKPLDTEIASGNIRGEVYVVEVVCPPTMPSPLELIKTTKNIPGGILWTPKAFVGDPSFLDENTNKIALCLSIVAEIDKGNKGFFNNAYFMNCDIATPEVKQFEFFKTQFMKLWKQPEPPTEDMLVNQFGGQMRLYLRNIAFRWFSYFHMGYSLKFTENTTTKPEIAQEAAA